MTPEYSAVLGTSNLGRTISLSDIGFSLPNGRDMAFLSYGGNCRDFEVGATYRIRLLFSVTYYCVIVRKDGREDKFWAEFRTASYEAAIAHPEFVRMRLAPDKVVPYFEILP